MAAGCISSSDCVCAGRGAISAMLPAAIRTPWLPSGKSNREAAAGRKPAGRRAKSLQALQPDGAVREQPACEPRDLPPVPVGRPEGFFGKGCGAGRAEHAGAGRIGPQDPLAVGGPQPGGQAARRIGRQSRIARAPATEIPHPSSRPHDRRHQDRQPDADSVKRSLLSQAGSGRSTARQAGA